MLFNNRFGYRKENLVIYHIFLDRFSRGKKDDKEWKSCTEPVFYGGNLQGVIDRLDYLEELGVNAIWLSPFTKTSAYHGYHTTDFFTVEPRFGDEKTLEQLLDRAHRKKMLVLMDFVPNHVSREHPFFKDAQTNATSVYREWFVFEHWPDRYKCFLHIDELPKLNLDHEATAQHVIGAAQYWLEKGVDGFRLDHVLGPSKKFWQRFVDDVRSSHPNTLLIGEARCFGIAWKDLDTLHVAGKRGAWIASKFGYDNTMHAMQQYTGLFDGVVDFPTNRLIREWATRGDDFDKVKARIAKHRKKFPSSCALAQFVDNHDMDRFLFIGNNDRSKLQQAAAHQFSLPEPAILYYGTEAGMSQTKSMFDFASHGDLMARQPMNWTKRDDDLFAFYKDIIAKKKNMRL